MKSYQNLNKPETNPLNTYKSFIKLQKNTLIQYIGFSQKKMNIINNQKISRAFSTNNRKLVRD